MILNSLEFLIVQLVYNGLVIGKMRVFCCHRL